jgi:hypothetical protein
MPVADASHVSDFEGLPEHVRLWPCVPELTFGGYVDLERSGEPRPLAAALWRAREEIGT